MTLSWSTHFIVSCRGFALVVFSIGLIIFSSCSEFMLILIVFAYVWIFFWYIYVDLFRRRVSKIELICFLCLVRENYVKQKENNINEKKSLSSVGLVRKLMGLKIGIRFYSPPPFHTFNGWEIGLCKSYAFQIAYLTHISFPKSKFNRRNRHGHNHNQKLIFFRLDSASAFVDSNISFV